MKVGNKYKVKWMSAIQEATITNIIEYEGLVPYSIVQVSMVDINNSSITPNATFLDSTFKSIILKSTWSCKPLYRGSL